MTNYIGEYRGKAKAIYHLEDTTDSSGNGYNLTNNNSVTFTPAKIKNGANFGTENTDKDLRVSNNLGITGGAGTILCILKILTEISTGQYTLYAQHENTNKTSLRLYYQYNSGTRRLAFVRSKVNVAEQATYYTITLGTSNFYRIALVYDGTNMMGYINGNLVSGPTAMSGAGSETISNIFCIGSQIGSNYSDALIDEVIVDNRAWSATEIKKYDAWITGRLL